MKKNEILLAILIAVVVLLFAQAPIIYPLLFPKEKMVFLGRPVQNGADIYTYVSYVEQAKQGKWLFIDTFTSEKQAPNLLRPSYVLIGKFAKLTSLPSVAAYNLAKIFFSIIFFISAYLLVATLFKTPNQRLFAFFILLTSSGLYWLVGNLNLIASTDFWVTESNTFLMLTDSPHYILSQSLMILSVLLYVKFIKEKKFIFGILTALMLFPLAFEHPFALVILAPVFFLSGIWMSLPLMRNFTVSALVAAPLIFPFLELRQNAIFAAEQSQGAAHSPSIFAWIFGYGLLIPFAFYGAKKHISASKPIVKLFIVWAVIVPFLLYLPVSFQRRLCEGLHIPIALLATFGILECYLLFKKEVAALTEYSQNQVKPVVQFLVILSTTILFLTPAYTIYRAIRIIDSNTLQQYYYYLATPESEAIEWMKNNVPDDAVILSNIFYGNIIAGSTARQVYLGHEAQTINYKEKVEKVNHFLLDTDNHSAYQFLKDNRIGYIFITKFDSMTKFGFKPDEKPYLEKVYDKEGIYVYKVKDDINY